MARPVLLNDERRTCFGRLNGRSRPVRTSVRQGKQSGRTKADDFGSFWLELALRNPLLRLTEKQRLSIKAELFGWTVKTPTGKQVRITAGKLSQRYQRRMAQSWFGRFKEAEKVFYKLASSKVYKYLLTVNGASDSINAKAKKISRLLRQNNKIGMSFKAIGCAPTYYKGRATLDKHVHFKLFATGRINKRNLTRKAKHLTGGSVNIERIGSSSSSGKDDDDTDGYLADQGEWPDRQNKHTGKTYGKTFKSFKKQQQKKLQASWYHDKSRKFGISTNSSNATGKHARAYLNTPKNASMSLTGRFTGRTSQPVNSSTMSGHHYSEAENTRRFNGLNIYSGQPLKSSSKPKVATANYHQINLGLNLDQTSWLFNVL